MKKAIFFYSFLFLLSPLEAAPTQPPARPYDVQRYRISFSLDPRLEQNAFDGTVEMTFKAEKALDEIELDAEEMKVHAGQFVGSKGAVTLDAPTPATLKVRFATPLKTGDVRTLSLRYTAQIRSAHEGMFRVVDPDEPDRKFLYFTHLEATSARKVFPCNDNPNDKALTEVTGTVPLGYQVLSNGEKTQESQTSIQGKPWTRFHWKLAKPHPTYLVAIAVGQFSKIATKVGKKELSVWVGKTKTEKARYALDVTKQTYTYFENYLGVKYPWSKYATVGIPTFLWGGMENTSSTHMNQERTVLNDPESAIEQKRITGLAAHELAHQWFGDYVTMKWWDDVWLNESFATLMGNLATGHVFKSPESQIEMVTEAWDEYFRQEDGPRSHPIVDKQIDSVADAFDSINYTKGANVLRMLTFYLGEDKFRTGVKTYLEKSAYANANYEDFFQSMEKGSGVGLSSFKESWLLKRGYPVLNYSGNWDAEKKTYHFTLKQKPNHKEDKTVFDFKIPVVFHRKAAPPYSKSVTLAVSTSETDSSVSLDAEPEWVTVNPGSVVLARWAPEKVEEEVLVKQATQDPDDITRVWAAFKLLEPVKKNEGSLGTLAQETTLKLLETDPSPYVRNAVLTHLQTSKAQRLPETLGNGILALGQKTVAESFAKSENYLKDRHGWKIFRSELLGTLGKVDSKDVLPFLTALLKNPALPLDDLGKTAQSVALLGDEKSAEILKSAVAVHKARGYRYQFLIQYAFGAYENPRAAQEINALSKVAGSDLMGRITNLINDNTTLKNSPEWSEFLKEFMLKNDRFGDEVKTRVLSTIEEVKNDHVKSLLETITKESESNRLKDLSRKILTKNFS